MGRMNLNSRWISWMKSCIFGSSATVLVNGSQTIDIVAQKGLQQVDPLAPFSFLLVVEGLAGLVNKAKKIGLLRSTKIYLFHSSNLLMIQY